MSEAWNNPLNTINSVVYNLPLRTRPLLPYFKVYGAIIRHPTVGGQTDVWLIESNGITVLHSLS